MKKLLCLCLFLPQIIFAQQIQTKFIEKVPLAADVFWGVDNFGAVYFQKDRNFFKQDGLLIWRHSNLGLGQLSHAGIHNPLQILLFYKNANAVVLLDHNLIEKKQIRFSDLEMYRTPAYVAMAAGENLWLFNQDRQVVEIWNERRQQNIRQSKPIAGKINGFFSNYNFCWIYTDSKLLKFDLYGVLISDLPISEIEKAVQDDGDVVFFKNEKFYFLPKEASEAIEIKLPQLEVKQFYLKDEILYIYDGQMVHQIELLIPKKD